MFGLLLLRTYGRFTTRMSSALSPDDPRERLLKKASVSKRVDARPLRTTGRSPRCAL
jgi:hypothetical protein